MDEPINVVNRGGGNGAIAAEVVVGNPDGHTILICASGAFATEPVINAAGRETFGYLDAPILGRPDACGRWTMPVGGTEEVLEKARPVLEAFSASVSHVGPPVSGNAIKLLNNLMFGAINAITVEAFALAASSGISQEKFYETVAKSDAANVSPLFRQVGRKIFDGDFSPTLRGDLCTKTLHSPWKWRGKREPR